MPGVMTGMLNEKLTKPLERLCLPDKMPFKETAIWQNDLRLWLEDRTTDSSTDCLMNDWMMN